MFREGLDLKTIKRMAKEMGILYYYSSGSPGIVDSKDNSRCVENFNTHLFDM